MEDNIEFMGKVTDIMVKLETKLQDKPKAPEKSTKATTAEAPSGLASGKMQTQMRDSLKRLVTIAEFKADKKVWDQKGNIKLAAIQTALEKSNTAFEKETKSGRLEHNNDKESHRLLALINGQINKFLTKSTPVAGEGESKGVFDAGPQEVYIAGMSPELQKSMDGAMDGGKVGEPDMDIEVGESKGLMGGLMEKAKAGLLKKLPIPAGMAGSLGAVAGIAGIAALILGSVLWMALDGIKGAFKADSWGVGKSNAIIASVDF